jgi:hypothetical protein
MPESLLGVIVGAIIAMASMLFGFWSGARRR